MSLKDRYENAPADTYVGRVRTLQSADAQSDRGVNFFDGVARGQGNEAPDEYQTEFTRNDPGSFLYGGNGLEPASTNDGSYPLSRWLEKGLGRAFTDEQSYFNNSRFTTIGNIRNGPETKLHNYAPIEGKAFNEAEILSDLVKGRIVGTAKGPSPAGLQG